MKIANNLIVNYKLSAENADYINKRRQASEPLEGNTAEEGQILPMVIVGIWSDSVVNGQVFLDGNDTLWVTSVPQGDLPGNWNYFMCDIN